MAHRPNRGRAAPAAVERNVFLLTGAWLESDAGELGEAGGGLFDGSATLVTCDVREHDNDKL